MIPFNTNNNNLTDNVNTNKLSYFLTMKFEIKENITVTDIPPPPKIAKNMLFHYGLIFKRTYLSKCLMNNVISVL